MPSLQASSLLATPEEEAQVRAELNGLHAALRAESSMQTSWEAEMRRQLSRRGHGLALHALAAEKITTPNSGYTGEIRRDGSIYIGQSGGLAAYNVALRLPETDAPITGIRIAFYPGINGGRLGHGRSMDSSFVLSSVHVSAGAVQSDQVDPHHTLALRRITASTENPLYPARAALDE